MLGQGSDGTFVLPGTHSKWAVVHDGRIETFATYLSGELFGVLKSHSILGRLMSGSDGSAGFERGVGVGIDPSGGLLNRLFSVRTLGLLGDLPQTQLANYLSGVIVGTEIGEARTRFGAVRDVTVIGDDGQADRYRRALGIAGIASHAGRPDAVAAGLWRIAQRAGLL